MKSGTGGTVMETSIMAMGQRRTKNVRTVAIGDDEALAEHAVVRLTRPVEADGRLLPAGAIGTVIHVYRNRAAYAVEFADPPGCVTDVHSGDLTLATTP